MTAVPELPAPPPSAKTHNIDSNALPAGVWDPEKVPESLNRIYAWTVGESDAAIGWYHRKKSPQARISKLIRFMAILLFGLGGLAPLVAATGLEGFFISGPNSGAGAAVAPAVVPAGVPAAVAPASPPLINFSQWGYVFLGLAAFLLGFDRFFGFSTSYSRYVTTALAAQRALVEFQLDWVSLLARAKRLTSETDVEPFLQRTKALHVAIRDLVEKETLAWATEFQTNLTELEKMVSIQKDSHKPGSITLTITNGQEMDGEIQVLVDDQLRQAVSGTRCQMSPIAIGQHRVSIRGLLKGKPAEASTTVVVGAGQTVEVSVTAKSQPAQ
jgi:hypothetical protein